MPVSNKQNISVTRESVSTIDTGENYLLTRLDHANNLINNFNYEKSRAVYAECLTGFNTVLFSDETRKSEAQKILEHINLKLYSYKNVYDARRHLYYKNHRALKNVISDIDSLYASLNSNIQYIDDSKRSGELGFMLFLSEARNQLQKYKKE